MPSAPRPRSRSSIAITASIFTSLALLAALLSTLRAQAAVRNSESWHAPSLDTVREADAGSVQMRPTGTLSQRQPGHRLAASQTITTVQLATGVYRWPAALAVDESLGMVYSADGDRGTVTLVNGPTYVDTIPVGQSAADIAIDGSLGYAYVSAPDPYVPYGGHVALIRGGRVITRLAVGGRPGPIAVDAQFNRAYLAVTTEYPFHDQVFVLQGERVLSVVSVPPGVVTIEVDSEQGRAYVLSAAGPRLSIIDGTVMDESPILLDSIDAPRDIALDPVSGRAYVLGESHNGSAGVLLAISGTHISGTQKIAQFTVGPGPRQVAVDPPGNRVYVTNAGDNTVTLISGWETSESIDAGAAPDAIAVDAARERVYVSNAGDSTTTVISGRDVVTTVSAGGGPIAIDAAQGIAYLSGSGLTAVQNDSVLGSLPIAASPARPTAAPQTGWVYVGNQGTNTVDILAGAEILGDLELGGRPHAIASDPLSERMYIAHDAGLTIARDQVVEKTLSMASRDVALDPVRGLAYVAGEHVEVISGTDHLGTVDIGRQPRKVAVNRATGLAYASAGGREEGFVAIISGTQRIGTVETGGTPDKLIVDPVRNRVFVTHPGQGRLSIIEGIQRRFPNIFLARPALDAAVNPVTGDLYVATRGHLLLMPELDSESIDLGLDALAVAVDVERGLAYATTRDGRLAVLAGETLLTTVPAGHRPVDLTIDSESGRVYVANFGSDTVTIVEPFSPKYVYLPLIQRH